MWIKPFAWRMAYLFTFRTRSGKDGFLSFIAWLSVLGIALGVAALIIILSVMNGFQKEVRDRMLSVVSHMEISSVMPLASINQLNDMEQALHRLDVNKQVRAVAPFQQTQAMLLNQDGQMQGVILRGIVPEQEKNVSQILEKTQFSRTQSFSNTPFSVLIGKPLAERFNLYLGDQITLAVADDAMTPLGFIPKSKAFTIVGIFDSGHYEFDAGLIMTHQKSFQALSPSIPISLRVRLDDLMQAPKLAKNWQTQWGDVIISDWGQQNKTWFAAVQTEKRMMWIILSLIVAVAAFNLVSGLVMTVKDKRGQIAIMRTFGASSRQILAIFMGQGMLIGGIGIMAGVLGGWTIAYFLPEIIAQIEVWFNIQFLPKDIYLINRLPSNPQTFDIILIGLMSVLLTLFASIYPSWRASLIDPAKILKQE